MNALSDLIRDSLLETTFPGADTSETIHIRRYHPYERSWQRRREAIGFERWIRRARIGQGGSASVWREECLDQEKEQPKVRAVKEIYRRGRAGRIDYTRELEAIAMFSQQKYDQIGCFVKSYGWYQTAESICIAMEYLELGDLQTYLYHNERPPLPEYEAQDIVHQMLLGLREMHDNLFVHRDLKLSNILIASCPPNHWWIKLAAYGISKRVGESQDVLTTTTKGTPCYMAPELLGLTERGEAFASDIWSAGEVTTQLLTKSPAFPTIGALVRYVATGQDSRLVSRLRHANISSPAILFIAELMSPRPHERCQSKHALNHPWIKETLPIPLDSTSGAYTSPHTNLTRRSPTEFASFDTITLTNAPRTMVGSNPPRLHPPPPSRITQTWSPRHIPSVPALPVIDEVQPPESSCSEHHPAERVRSTGHSTSTSSNSHSPPDIDQPSATPRSGHLEPSRQRGVKTALRVFDQDITSFCGGKKPCANDIFIAIAGLTGSGKTSFILRSMAQLIRAGYPLGGFTVDVYSYSLSPFRAVYLIDTPGFDHQTPKAHVLLKMVRWLAEPLVAGILLHRIIYLHQITNTRMLKLAKNSFTMLEQLYPVRTMLGETYSVTPLKKVYLVTTMWNEFAVGSTRAAHFDKEVSVQLNPNPRRFGGYHRYDDTQGSARRIIGLLVEDHLNRFDDHLRKMELEAQRPWRPAQFSMVGESGVPYMYRLPDP
ncbi:kinase-like domain-containing protein [Aspergillus karnatakaensis]|uniref:kinase-like domain-containing protein n=1 Tax=Aspergillus karnatakaensis TaxID=1810916 RepID=UPI003CCE3402